MWIALFSHTEAGNEGIIDQVTRSEIGIVALKKTFIFLRGWHTICISIFFCHNNSCFDKKLFTIVTLNIQNQKAFLDKIL